MDCPRCRTPSAGSQDYCAHCGASLHRAASPGGPASPRESASAAGGPAGDTPTGGTLQTRDELETGTTFAGRYQIIEELGRGGMGRVYKVIDQETRSKIALKLIRPEIAADPAVIDRFRQELTTARGLAHRNICRVFDLGRDGDTYYLTMEYVSGEDLKSMIAMSGQLGVGTAISIAKQVCTGLAEAHRAGVVHRDLKPQNIQIDRGGHAKIMDFGIARSGSSRGLTGSGVIVGTPQYMSPEQVDAKHVDARSDLYALGVILYEMLTGRVPFDADTPLAVAVKQKLEKPRDPRELNAAIPADLDRVILRCLEKEPAGRYQSAADLRADLARIEQGLPTAERVVPQQRATTSREITVHFTVRQLLTPALIVIAVLAVAAGAWRFWPRQAAVAGPPPGGKPALAVLYFENISGDQALNTWRTGLPELLTTGLLESRAINVVSTDRVFGILKKLNLADAKRYSDEDLAGIAREGSIQYLVTGSVMRAGQSTVITARLQNAATRELVDSRKIECASEDEILAKADGLTRQIGAALSASPQDAAAKGSEPLTQVMTSSPQALKYYTEARRFHLNNQYSDAIRLYEQAVDADPGFAMAYRGMAACYSNNGESAKAEAAASKALSLSDRLPERLKYQIAIAACSNRGDYAGAADAARELVAKYPDDGIGLNKLGTLAMMGGEFEKAAGYLEAAAGSSPTLLAAENVAAAYRFLGQYDRAASVIAGYLDRDPDNARAHVALGTIHMAAGRLDAAEREAEQASMLAPSDAWVVQLRGVLARLRGDFAAAERHVLPVFEHGLPADRQSAAHDLASLYAAQGRFDEALQYAAQTPPEWSRAAAIELDRGRPAQAAKAYEVALAAPGASLEPIAGMLARVGLAVSRAAAGDAGGAERAAADLEAKGRTFFEKPAARWKLAVSGTVALKRGDARAAVRDLERAAADLPYQAMSDEEHALLYDLLARAYVTAGDLAKARQTYERIGGLTTGRTMWGGIYARSFYHLGMIAEKQGDAARARESFATFLDLWKNADPGLLEVADARRRMGR